MSELIDQAKARRETLKHLILQLHEGKSPDEVKSQLLKLLGRVPYSEVVEVEQQLISEGLPSEEVLKLCDLHSAAMKGALDTSQAKAAPPGHPVDTFKKENEALAGELALTDTLSVEIKGLDAETDATEQLGQLRLRFSRLADIDKHYSRKENLLFPYLEKKNITGPPTVMWGKDDEVRELVKAATTALESIERLTADEALGLIELVITPATDAIKEMIFKEEEILFPMCMDALSDAEWYAIVLQSPEIGFCIYDPTDIWKPEDTGVAEEVKASADTGKVQFPSGSLTPDEIRVILNSIPFDLTFVGADDTVRFFTQGRERIFERNRAIIGRKVQMCHPLSSVHIVQQILDDFKSGWASQAPFWIELHGKFIHIEYFAVRDEEGTYLGTLEVSQDLTEKRALTGEQRLLSYAAAKE
jgi:DUF438 domain-containing protein